MTGTPLDLTHFGGFLTALGWAYWGAALAVLALAIWLPKGRRWKFVAGVVAVALIYVILVRPIQLRVQTQRAQQARVDEAAALFRRRCESAGEKISRTVDNVEGIVWMKWRPPYRAEEAYDQFALDDPYGRDCHAQDCIQNLLRLDGTSARFDKEVGLRRGRYAYVESTDPSDGQRYRYVGTMKPAGWSREAIEKHRKETGTDIPDYSYRFSIERLHIEAFRSRYGVTWDDISTREDREHWIAGGSLKVIDLQTNEVIAERIGYMIDRGQGSQEGFRMPWVMAERNACPAFGISSEGYPMKLTNSRGFVFKVLIPSKGE